MTTSLVHVRSLRVDYEGVKAVNDVSFDIHEKEIYGLVGPNGAGKTSTIKALANVLEPTYGEIKLVGYDLELAPKKALSYLGYMPDFSPVYPHLKVWEYLDVFGAAYLIPPLERKSRIDYWLTRVNLKEKYNSFVKDLSRGMTQRLVLAKTLLHDPKILILDEPASGLDPTARIELREIIKSVAHEGKAIIISSHILTELSDFCTSIGIMEKGKMVVSGSLEEIRKQSQINSHLFIRLVGLENKQKLHELLKNISSIGLIEETKPNEFKVSFTGNASDANQILKMLINNDLDIADFHSKEANVEDIFFKIGAKEVS